MIMPFGKFKGLALEDLPEDYFYWLAGLDDLREPLRSAVADERHRRKQHIHRPLARPCPDPELAESLVGAGIRSLVKKTHPDAGGSHDAFLRVGEVGDTGCARRFGARHEAAAQLGHDTGMVEVVPRPWRRPDPGPVQE